MSGYFILVQVMSGNVILSGKYLFGRVISGKVTLGQVRPG